MSDLVIPDRSERIGSAKSAMVEALEKKDPELAKAFEELTPEQKEAERQAGHLMAKLMTATGNVAVEDAFTWYEQETGKPLDTFNRIMAMTMAIQHGGPNDRNTYNAIRKNLITVNTR